VLSVLVLGEGSFRLFRSALAAPSRKLFEALDINSIVDFSAWLDNEQPKTTGSEHYCDERYKDCFHDLCSTKKAPRILRMSALNAPVPAAPRNQSRSLQD
jgi:hypothetical protein